MGGGDLNLKKSWHPHTLKNQEKVWKAEQAKTQEDKKLNDLRREIEQEKNQEELKRIGKESGILGGNIDGDKKLDWMYKSSTELINREEYLLGRKIDKSFEILQSEEREKDQQNLVGVKQSLNHVEHECVPFSIRAYKNFNSSEQVDLQRKVMEDPLMLIKQREIESRRKILENPVKLKELHRILKTDEKLRKVSKKSKKLKKEKKSKKKHKKSKKSDLNSASDSLYSDSSSDLDSKLAKKLKTGFLNRNENDSICLNLSKLLDSKFEKISLELDKAAGTSNNRYKKNTKKRNDSYAKSSSDEEQSRLKRHSRPFSKDAQFPHKDHRSRSVSEDREKRYNKYENIKSRRQNSRSRTNSRSRDKDIKRPHDCKRSRSVSRNKDLKLIQRSKNSSRSIGRNEINGRGRKRSNSKDRKQRNRRKSRSLSRSRMYQTSNKRYVRSRTKSTDFINRLLTKSEFNTSQSQTSVSTVHRSSKLTDEQKQAKLREMMSNAAWREEERTEVVRKHREANAEEEERHSTRKFDKDFLNKEVKKAIANQTSVGSRLRANLNNIQRSSAAMNSNFARK